MDPITLAIVAAVTAGVTAGATEVSKQVIVDAYQGFKTLLKKKFSHQSPELIKAVDELESDPQSKGRAITLAEKVVAAKANEDQEVLAAAQALREALESTPEGKQVVSKYQIDAKNAQIGVIGDHTKIEGGMHFGGQSKDE